MTRFLLTPVAAAATALALLIPSAQAETNFGQVAMHVAYMLQNHHYSKQDFDDKVSGEMLHNYLNMLDFKHIFFTQKDVDEFKDKYETTLDDLRERIRIGCAGKVVSAAPAPDGGYDALVVLQTSSADAAQATLGAPTGPALSFLPLPYALG